MGLLDPQPPPYDPLEWRMLPFAERTRQVCQAWATQGYGTPLGAFSVYGVKILFYVAAWVFFCAFHPDIQGWSDLGSWWLTTLAFQKAILWSLTFEVMGFGCGSGPLTGRYFPPFGGLLHFLRPGTTKMARWPELPVVGGTQRSWLDVAVYAALLIACFRGLVAADPTPSHFLPVVVLLAAFLVLDRTVALAARSEHYLVTSFCFLFPGDALAGAKAVQLALWAWAGVSKLNHHFPTVVCVMQSNSPFTTPAFRQRLYRDYPNDLRPSPLAERLAHFGTALELLVPLFLGLGGGGPLTWVGMALMLLLHGFITSNVPMGVPLEWNVMVVYGAFFLFGTHAEVSVLGIESGGLAVVLVVTCVLAPLAGNLWPHRLSFLFSMRYYAGNWPFSVWLFRGDAHRKLERVKKSSPWVFDQLSRFYDDATSIGLFGKVLGFRAMHLHGRILQLVMPRLVEHFEDYEYVDGEIVAGLVLGYNFGDGHLHQEELLEKVQSQCRFEPGELRCLFVESQPLLRDELHYRLHDAATGLREAGTIPVSELRALQPWPEEAVDPTVPGHA
ncbi:MAG: DUF3556 domain-containing protein [Myxococcota bacterium]